MSAASLVAHQTARPPRFGVWRRIFSFPGMLTGLLVVLAVLTVRARFDDPDMWWHLRTGQIIWTTRSVPLADHFSYTSDQHVPIPHEWLAQVLIYGTYRLGGYPGLMLGLCVSSAALLIASYVLCWIYSGNTKVGFPGGLKGAPSRRWSAPDALPEKYRVNFCLLASQSPMVRVLPLLGK